MPNKIVKVDLYPIIEQERPYLFQITGPRGGMRAYQKPGSNDPLWSVTTVLGMTSGQAADLGTRAHDLLSEYISSRIEETDVAVTVPEDLQIIWDSFHKWEEETNIARYLKTEFAVYSESFKYAGSVDALALTKDGRWMVLDWKTSKDLYPENAMQVAAYANALSFPLLVRSEGDPDQWDTWEMIEPWVIRLGKEEAGFEAKQVTNPQLALDGFLNAMTMWYALGLPGITDKAKEELEEHFKLPEGLPSVW
jgi:hypothetical protein